MYSSKIVSAVRSNAATNFHPLKHTIKHLFRKQLKNIHSFIFRGPAEEHARKSKSTIAHQDDVRAAASSHTSGPHVRAEMLVVRLLYMDTQVDHLICCKWDLLLY